MNFGWHMIIATLVGLFFLIPGIIELAMWRRFADSFVEWGYPRFWPIVTYLLKIAGGAMTLYAPTRPVGLAICACISLAALATIILRKVRSEYRAIPVNIIALALIGFAFASMQ